MRFLLYYIPILASLAALSIATPTELRFNVGSSSVGGYAEDPTHYLIGYSSPYSQTRRVPTLAHAATHRWAPRNSSGFGYSFPVGPGEFDITLSFAEIYSPNFGVGRRIFNVEINKQLVLRDLDVFKLAGADKELRRTFRRVKAERNVLSVLFAMGSVQCPMVSAIVIRKSDGGKITLDKNHPKPSGNRLNKTSGFDHQAHAVPGNGYGEVDYDDDKRVTVTLDGSGSHSHYYNHRTKEHGRIVSYKWEMGGKVIGTTVKTTYTHFPLGRSVVKLTVVDQTGDTASAETTVTGFPESSAGAYCYFYPGATSLPHGVNSNPKPKEGYHVKNINFPSVDDFPFSGKTGDKWAMRCLGKITVENLRGKKIGVSRKGRVVLYLEGKPLLEDKPGNNTHGVITAAADADKEMRTVELLYFKSGPAAELRLLLAGKPLPPDEMVFSRGLVLPTVTSISPTVAHSQGGGKLHIRGTGFVNKPSVRVGAKAVKVRVVSDSEIFAVIPSSRDAGGSKVSVLVKNSAGVSNGIPLTYSTEASTPVKWRKSYFRAKNGSKLNLEGIVSVAVGPDFHYYFGSRDGYVHKVLAGKNLQVTFQCKSPRVGESRSILGIAFNPRNPEPIAYITTSTLFRNSDRVRSKLRNTEDGWANGAVESLRPGCGCMCAPKKIITGLPVSHHDHGVNQLLFRENGDLLITVGGTTNAGHNTPRNKLGGLAESPLSGAIILARLSKGKAFDGAVTYDQYKDPETAKQIGGKDVVVFAAGLRNSLGMALTHDNKLYATDNGANQGFGRKSTTCTTDLPLKHDERDELNYIVENGYYGHPNRNRGRTDPAQCIYGSGRAPLATFEPSTNGILQYRSNAFMGSLKGDLVATKYAPPESPNGKAYRVVLDDKGQVTKSFVMVEYSGLSVANGLYGELVMPRVAQSMIAVLVPEYTEPTAPFVLSVSPFRGVSGQTVLVTGHNFKRGLKATFGGKPCAEITEVSKTSFRCKVPNGTGTVAVSVTTDEGSSRIMPLGDFKYLRA